GNDRWRASFCVEREGWYFYTVEGWIDKFRTWRNDLEKRIGAEQDIKIDLRIGPALIDGAAQRASGAEADRLRLWAASLRQEQDERTRRSLALAAEVATLARAVRGAHLARSS